MTPTERDRAITAMALACRDHLSRADALLVARVTMEQPDRMCAYLNVTDGRGWTPAEFAAYALRCAKRIHAGGES